MSRKVVWKLSEEDFEDIQDLYEKKLALENLTKIIDVKDSELYGKLVKDYGTTLHKFNNWWNLTSEKYKWEGRNWWVNFDTKEIISES
jgi:CXXX repeat modification system protein